MASAGVVDTFGSGICGGHASRAGVDDESAIDGARAPGLRTAGDDQAQGVREGVAVLAASANGCGSDDAIDAVNFEMCGRATSRTTRNG